MKRTWVTKDGSRIPIRSMSDRHLQNTIAMLERNEGSIDFDPFTDEMVEYHMPEEYDALVRERDRRVNAGCDMCKGAGLGSASNEACPTCYGTGDSTMEALQK